MTPEELRDLLPAYALGALDEAEHTQMEAALASDPNLLAELATYEEVLVDLALSVRQVTPPPRLKTRIMEAVTPAPQARVFQWKPFVLVAAAFLIILGGVLIWQIANPAPTQQERMRAIMESSDSHHIALSGEAEFADVAGEFVIAANRREAVLWLADLELLPEKSYQLWLGNEENERLSMAVFAPESDQSEVWVLVKLPSDFRKYTRLGLTVEPQGGSKAPSPTRVLGAGLPNE